MAYQLKGIDPAATLKNDTLTIQDNKVVSDISQTVIFETTQISNCQFFYNKIPLTTEIENKP